MTLSRIQTALVLAALSLGAVACDDGETADATDTDTDATDTDTDAGETDTEA